MFISLKLGMFLRVLAATSITSMLVVVAAGGTAPMRGDPTCVARLAVIHEQERMAVARSTLAETTARTTPRRADQRNMKGSHAIELGQVGLTSTTHTD